MNLLFIFECAYRAIINRPYFKNIHKELNGKDLKANYIWAHSSDG